MLETVIITLMHISIYSEEVELEVYVLPFHFVYLFRVLFYVRQRTSNIPRVSAGHFPTKQYTLNIYIQKIFCVPLGFICANFFNFLNCLEHCACGLTCSSRTILGKYLKPVVSLAEDLKMTNKKSIERQPNSFSSCALCWCSI